MAIVSLGDALPAGLRFVQPIVNEMVLDGCIDISDLVEIIMPTETFEYRRQARGPKNYIALWMAMMVLYFAWAQGWGFMATILCGPFLGMIIVRLVLNEAEGFRLTELGLEYYSLAGDRRIKWRDLRAVVISGDGMGGAKCLLHTSNGASAILPATDAFSPDRLGQEFKSRGIPIWSAELEDQNAAFSAQH